MTVVLTLKENPNLVLAKAFDNACVLLKLSKSNQAKLLGMNPSTLSRNKNKGFSPESHTGQIQLAFVRVYRSLYAISGGDSKFMRHWFTTENKALHGTPEQVCLTIEGLFRTNQYLSAMRGKV